MRNMNVKIEKTSKVILFLGVATIALLTAVNYFIDSWQAISYIAPVLVLTIALFVFVEVGYFSGFRKKDIWRMAGSIIALLALVGVVTELIPQIPEITFLSTIKGMLSAFLALYFVVEGFR